MLPVTVQFIVAMLAYALNERMTRKAEYVREENRVLKEAVRAAPRVPMMDPTNASKRDEPSAAWHLHSARDGCVAVEGHVRTVLVIHRFGCRAWSSTPGRLGPGLGVLAAQRHPRVLGAAGPTGPEGYGIRNPTWDAPANLAHLAVLRGLQAPTTGPMTTSAIPSGRRDRLRYDRRSETLPRGRHS